VKFSTFNRYFVINKHLRYYVKNLSNSLTSQSRKNKNDAYDSPNSKYVTVFEIHLPNSTEIHNVLFAR
tara:strand:- start:225 stop:428 length:204 start_codon:yes stop_codon:yes gene_type:complete